MKTHISRNFLAIMGAAITISGCVSSELTYKAISKANDCKLHTTVDIWNESDHVRIGTTTQYNELSGAPGFTDPEINAARAFSLVLLKDFKLNISNAVYTRLGNRESNNKNICRLRVTPIEVTHDVRGGDVIVLKSTITNDSSGNIVWSIKTKSEAPRSGSNLKLVESFARRLVSELTTDGFVD